MSSSRKLGEIAVAIAGFAAAVGFLALIFFVAGFASPMGTAVTMFAKILAFTVFAVLIVIGLMVGKGLFKSAAPIRKIAGALLFVTSLAIGLYAAFYIYSGAGGSDCPAGIPARLC